MDAHALSIEKRLETLERENRRCKRFATVLVVAIGLVFFAGMGQSQEKIVEARQFVLKDSEGKLRAVLQHSDGRTALRFFDDQGRPPAEFSLDKEGPALGLNDHRGRSVTLSATRKSTGIAITHANNEIAAAVGTAPAAGAHLVLRDETGKTLFQKP